MYLAFLGSAHASSTLTDFRPFSNDDRLEDSED